MLPPCVSSEELKTPSLHSAVVASQIWPNRSSPSELVVRKSMEIVVSAITPDDSCISENPPSGKDLPYLLWWIWCCRYPFHLGWFGILQVRPGSWLSRLGLPYACILLWWLLMLVMTESSCRRLTCYEWTLSIPLWFSSRDCCVAFDLGETVAVLSLQAEFSFRKLLVSTRMCLIELAHFHIVGVEIPRVVGSVVG